MGAAALPRIRSLGDLSSQGHSAPLSSKHLRRFRLSGLGLWLGAWGLGLGLVLHSWVGLRLGSNPSNLKPSSISQAQIRGNASSTGSENKGRPIAAVSWVASRPEPGTTKMCGSVSARPLLHNYDALRLSCELTNSRTCLKIPPPLRFRLHPKAAVALCDVEVLLLCRIHHEGLAVDSLVHLATAELKDARALHDLNTTSKTPNPQQSKRSPKI